MSPFFIVSLVILVILVVALIVLYFLGKRAQKKQQEQQEKIDAMAQTVSILVIDKGRMKLKELVSLLLYWKARQNIYADPKFMS